MPAKLILASGSPRRRQLLAEAGYVFDVSPPEESVEESAPVHPDAAEYVAELARRKAEHVAATLAEPAVVLAADTVAECDGRILGKPADVDDARRILQVLSGRDHRVLTGVCCLSATSERLVEVAVTSLRMARLSDQWLDEYLASGAWRGKAGAFGYQDDLGVVKIAEGTASNVVGLPLEVVRRMLAEAGAFPAPNGGS